MSDTYDRYQGVVVPMATPFEKNGNPDHESTGRMLDFLLDHNTIPFILGTTGEGTSPSLHSREAFVSTLLDHRRHGVPTIAGIMGLSHSDTVTEANKYFKLGLDAVVLTLPNYYMLDEQQILHYYKSLSERIQGNLILYNIPKTIHMSIPVDVIEQLSKKENIIGIKDSEYDEARLEKSLKFWKDRRDFFHLTGVNKLMVKGLMLGSRGVVPSTGNFAPGIYTEIVKCCLEDKEEEATDLLEQSQKYCDVYQANRSLASSLSALKIILAEMGLCQRKVLPPLIECSKADAEEIVLSYQKIVKP